MKQDNVFISYKTENTTDALWVKSTLEDNGYSCWMAPMSIPGGSSYAKEIPQAIEGCTFFVLILSKAAMHSTWIPKELDQALNAGKVIMPFLVEPTELTSEFKFYLSNVQWYDAYKNRLASIQTLLRDMQKIAPPESEKPESMSESPDTSEEKTPKDVPITLIEKVRESIKSGEDVSDTEFNTDTTEKSEIPILWVDDEEEFEDEEDFLFDGKPSLRGSGRTGKKARHPVRNILLTLAVIVIALTATLIINNLLNRVVIADTVFSKEDSWIVLRDRVLTEKDLKKLSEFEYIGMLEIKNCVFTPDNLHSITDAEPQGLRIVNCDLSNRQLSSLDFEKTTYLDELDLSANPALTDLRTLAPLADTLEKLVISGTGVTDLNPISEFVELRSFYADHAGIEDLSPLSKMIYLRELAAAGNNISSLAGLENMTTLITVNLRGNHISDLSLLTPSCEKLEYLRLDGNEITDLTPLTNCTKLKRFTADRNRITSLAPLASCTELDMVSANGNRIETLAGITNWTNLTYLDLSYNNIPSIAESDAPVFRENANVTLNLAHNRIESAVLRDGQFYSNLFLHNNPIADLSGLTELDGDNLYVTYHPDTDMRALAQTTFFKFHILDTPLNQRVNLESIFSSLYFDAPETVEQALAEAVPVQLR